MDTKRLQGLICAGMLSGALVLTGVANAAVVTNRLPLLGYADHNISVYRTPGGMTSAVVAAETALIQITQVRADGWAYGTYPMSNGRRASGWFRMNDVQGDVNFNNVNGKILYQQTVYRTTAMSGGNGVLPQGASVLVIAEQGGLSQIVYKQPNSMNWRLGWVLSDAVQKEQKIVAPVNQTRSSVTSQAKTSSATKTAAQPKTNVDTKTTEQPKTSVVTKTVAQSGTDTASKNVAQKPELNTEIKTTTSTQPTASNNTEQSKQTVKVENNTLKPTVSQSVTTGPSKAANKTLQVSQNNSTVASTQNSVKQTNTGTAAKNTDTQPHLTLTTTNNVGLVLGREANQVINKYGKALQRIPVYTNTNLSSWQNGAYLNAGSTFVVLETANTSYKITYLGNNKLQEGWVNKNYVSLLNVDYKIWQGKMNQRANAFYNIELNQRSNQMEYADNGDDVTVLNEKGNAYFISYPLTNGSYKARWVEKSAVSGPNPNNRVVVPVVKEDTNPIIKPVERTNNGIKGDMNQDGKVDQTDLDIMKNIILEKIPSNNVYKQVGDMNNDGKIDIIDLSQLVSLVPANTKSVNATTNNQVNKSVTLADLNVVYPANGLYSIQPMCAPNTELTVQGASKNEGANVFIYSIASDWHKEPSHQKWYIERIGNTEWYKITAENSGHALNIHGGTSVNGTNVSIWPYSANAKHHQFRFLDAGNGYYVIQGNISGNFVLDVNNAGNANETNVQIYSFNNSGAQKWKLVRRSSVQANAIVNGLNAGISSMANIAKRSVYVYTDSSLTKYYDNCWIVNGQKYSILQTSGNALKVQFNNQFQNNQITTGWVTTDIKQSLNFEWPTTSKTLTVIYYYVGATGEGNQKGGPHSCKYHEGGKPWGKAKPLGIDISSGSVAVKAAEGGTVLLAGEDPKTTANKGKGFGYRVEIDHGEGKRTWYAHLKNLPNVREKQYVKKGEVIGFVGSTGNSSGPHLHFEMNWINPYEYFSNMKNEFIYAKGFPANDPWNREWFEPETTPKQREIEYRKRHNL